MHKNQPELPRSTDYQGGQHIAIIVRSFSADGGLELYTHKVVEGLLARGLRITVFCQESLSNFKHPCLRVITFQAPDKDLPRVSQMAHQFKKATEAVKLNGPFDLVHSQHFPVSPAHVVTFHNHSVAHLGSVGTIWENLFNKTKAMIVPAYRLRNSLDQLLCRNARCFIFPSYACRDDFYMAYRGLFPIQDTPYVVARPGSDLISRRQSHQAPADPAPGNTFLFVGRGYRRKGLDIILKACCLLHKRGLNFRLLIAGLSEKPLDSLKLKLLGLDSHVQYLGFRRDMEAVYSQASAFVIASRHDVFGMAPLQAMHYALVPIVSRCMGVSELLADGDNALILENHLDAVKLAELMQGLIDNPAKLSRLKANVKAVAANTSWDKCVASTLEAYRLAGNLATVRAVCGEGTSRALDVNIKDLNQ